jgi:hypothetical protein
MKGASQLHTLNLASCSKLSKLPEKLPASLQKLDLSYCRELASMGESLLNIAHQIGEAEVVLAGWEYLLAEHMPVDVHHKQQLASLVPAADSETLEYMLCPALKLSDPQSASAVMTALRRATVIE